jgi:hypothetical protein
MSSRSLRSLYFSCLLAAVFAIAAPEVAFAMDRAIAVHSRIESALSGILPRSDYLVIVNRMDEIEDGGASAAATGQVRRLPGLNVGVDDIGRVTRSEENAGQYNGGLSISVIIDPVVKAETYELIEKNISDLAGGLRDTDEFRISSAVLRQPPPPSSQSPQVEVNNNLGDKDANRDSLLQQVAIGLALLGLFVWVISRLLNKPHENSPSTRMPPPDQASQAHQMNEEKTKAQKQFAELDPLLTGLYLMRSQNNRQADLIRGWAHAAEPSTQRAVLMALPGWMSSSLEKTVKEAIKDLESPSADPAAVYLEISVLEQNLKDPAEKSRALLCWFPATYLRDVPSHQRDSLSKESRAVLWYLRPDLGDFVRQQATAGDLSSENYDQALEPPTNEAIQKCFEEISTWNSKGIIGDRSLSRDNVAALANMVNQLREFGPIESLVNQSKDRLSAEEFARLETMVVWQRTPLSWSNAQAKDWLRAVDPHDYIWWSKLIGQKPDWKLGELLRPLRLSMFSIAENEQLHATWNEGQKKIAAERLLKQMRVVHFGKDSINEQAA